MKKLHRSRKDKVVSGVIGGIGEYLDIDPTLLRLVFVFITIMTGIFPAIIFYIIAVLIVRKTPEVSEVIYMEPTEKNDEGQTGWTEKA